MLLLSGLALGLVIAGIVVAALVLVYIFLSHVLKVNDEPVWELIAAGELDVALAFALKNDKRIIGGNAKQLNKLSLGVCYRLMDKKQEYKDCFEQITKNPFFAAKYRWMIIAYLWEGNVSAAKVMYREQFSKSSAEVWGGVEVFKMYTVELNALFDYCDGKYAAAQKTLSIFQTTTPNPVLRQYYEKVLNDIGAKHK
jgi:hypothetical protein